MTTTGADTRLEFASSQPLTVGVELELQLLDGGSLDLKDGILPLLEFYPGSEYVKPEFIQNTVEIASKVCASIAELHVHMQSLLDDLDTRCRLLGMRLCGAGTHPFCGRLALITPKPRYVEMEQHSGYLAHTQIVFATHVHIGVTSGDAAMRVLCALKPYLPLLIAISANSPFWRGYDTGHACYRQRILAATRSYGIPPSFPDWQAFACFFESARRAGMFEDVNDIHWDLRPRPHFGTVEVRAMDAQSTVAATMALAGFVRALVAFLERDGDRRDGLPRPLPWWLEKENHYQAARLGMDALYVADAEGRVEPLRGVWERVLAALRPTAAALGEGPYLDAIAQQVAIGPGYVRQRETYQRSGALEAVVGTLADELKREAGAAPFIAPC